MPVSKPSARRRPLWMDQGTLRRRLDQNCGELVRSLHARPAGFDDREDLWMDRFRMLREMEALDEEEAGLIEEGLNPGCDRR